MYQIKYIWKLTLQRFVSQNASSTFVSNNRSQIFQSRLIKAGAISIFNRQNSPSHYRQNKLPFSFLGLPMFEDNRCLLCTCFSAKVGICKNPVVPPKSARSLAVRLLRSGPWNTALFFRNRATGRKVYRSLAVLVWGKAAYTTRTAMAKSTNCPVKFLISPRGTRRGGFE